MSVLGEFVLVNSGHAWTRTLLELGEHLGLKDKATRQALSRLEQRGHLTRSREGRQTRWHLTEPTTDLLQDGAERIYAFGRGTRPWAGNWLVVLASVPERDRQARYRMTGALNFAGFGSLGQGTWLCPWVDREASAVEILGRLEVDATIFRAELGQLGSGRDLAERAWDLPALADDYRSFLSSAEAIDRSLTGAAAAAAVTSLVHQWRQFPLADPDLPAELLPADWPGHRAAATFTECRAALTPAAQGWWRASER